MRKTITFYLLINIFSLSSLYSRDPLREATRRKHQFAIASGITALISFLSLPMLKSKLQSNREEMEEAFWEKDGKERYNRLKKKQRILRVLYAIAWGVFPTSAVLAVYHGVGSAVAGERARTTDFYTIQNYKVKRERPQVIKKYIRGDQIHWAKLKEQGWLSAFVTDIFSVSQYLRALKSKKDKLDVFIKLLQEVVKDPYLAVRYNFPITNIDFDFLSDINDTLKKDWAALLSEDNPKAKSYLDSFNTRHYGLLRFTREDFRYTLKLADVREKVDFYDSDRVYLQDKRIDDLKIKMKKRDFRRKLARYIQLLFQQYRKRILMIMALPMFKKALDDENLAKRKGFVVSKSVYDENTKQFKRVERDLRKELTTDNNYKKLLERLKAEKITLEKELFFLDKVKEQHFSPAVGALHSRLQDDRVYVMKEISLVEQLYKKPPEKRK